MHRRPPEQSNCREAAPDSQPARRCPTSERNARPVKPPDKTFAANPAVLRAFVRAVAIAGDSPTVVRRVAENTAYVYLCRAIVQLDITAGVPALLQEACREADITPPRLIARLTPVAQALRLMPEDRGDTYYKLLGVPPESDATLIRKAFRRRARDLHPDAQTEQAADPQAFSALTTAYQTLRDPVAKEAYDARRDPEGTWFEPDPQPKPARRRPARFTAVIVVVLLLVAATLVLDHLYRESARQNAYHPTQTVATHSVNAPTRPTADTPAAPPRVAESIPAAPADDAPAISATAPTPAHVSPETAPAVFSAALSRTATDPPVPIPVPVTPQPSATPDLPPTAPEPMETVTDHAVVVDHRRVTVFYTSKDDARLSKKLAAFLADQGYPQPRIAQAPSGRASDIRFFNAADRDDARSLKNTVRDFLAQATGRPDLPVHLKNLSQQYPRADQGLLEVWINTRPPGAGPATAAPVTTAAASATPLPPATRPAPPDPAQRTDARIRAFLDDYCRTYESRDPDRLADLFETAATENGQPFADVLPRYRANMARIERLSYRIEVERWEPLGNAQTLSVQGRFFAEGQLTDHKKYHSQGTIALDIVPHGKSYLVERLAYQIDK